MEPFTLRRKDALVERRITVSIRPQLRERIWQTIQAHNSGWRETTETGFNFDTDHLEQTETKLKRLLGKPELVAKTPDGDKKGIKAYFKEGYPSNVLEVVEQFCQELDECQRDIFAKAINESMIAFECPWLLFNGVFFRIDSQSLGDLLKKLQDQFSRHGFEGAEDELREAQEAFSDNRTKDAILAALKSFESTLKTVLGTDKGTASELIKGFQNAGYLDDIPKDRANKVANAVLIALAALRNALAAHGQASEKIIVPKSYATLAIHLAAALNSFIVEQKIAKTPTGTLKSCWKRPMIRRY